MTATTVKKMLGGDLLSHPVPRAVLSAQTGLASGFGMEPGVSPSLWPPKLYGDVPGMTRPHLGNRIVDASTPHIKDVSVASYRLISTGQLHASFVRTSTSSLSTQ